MKTKLFVLLALLTFSGSAQASEQGVFTCRLENNTNITVKLGLSEGVREHLLEVRDGNKLLVSEFAHEILFKAMVPYREFAIYNFNGRIATVNHGLHIAEDGSASFRSETLQLSDNCIPE